MNQILSKEEKEKINENYGTEKTEDNNISIDLENKIINKDNKNKSKSKEEEKNHVDNSPSDKKDNKSSNKSNSLEKQDTSEDMIMTISSNKKYHQKKKLNSNNNQNFSKHYETMVEYEKRRLEKIVRLRKYLENIEIKKLRPKPEISKYSKQLINASKNNKESLIQRMKDEEEKTKQKRKLLAEKIKEERIKRKKDLEKKPEFKVKKLKMDKKFNKFYTNMIEKDKIKKEKFAKFTEVVRDYELSECVFQPNLTELDENKYKNLNSNKLIQRLYDEELKKRDQKKKDLEKKYTPSFKPNLIKKTLNFNKKLHTKNNKKITGSRNIFGGLSGLEKRLNRTIEKRPARKLNLKESDKKHKHNITDDNLANKSVDNIYVDEMKTEIINNFKNSRKLKSNDKDKKEKLKK